MGKQSRRKRELRAGEISDAIEGRKKPSETIAYGGICDFCSSPDVKWAYLTDESDPTEPRGVKHNRGWSACDVCHDLIERGQHDALARRSAETFVRKYPVLGQLSMKALTKQFGEFHKRFREHRVGKPITDKEFRKKYGPLGGPEAQLGGRIDQFMQMEGLDILTGEAQTPGGDIGRPVPGGEQVLHHVEAGYVPEGFTPEQLTDPRTVEYLMNRIQRDRPTPNIPLTVPVQPVIREWVGARTYKQAVSAVYGETPRSDDLFPPRPSMLMAQIALEALLGAHPVVLEPEQMNAIDEGDWSFPEANDYAEMAHLPFEPVYIDFGGHEPVMVDLRFGPCRLHGAAIWRSGMFRIPTLAIAPIGGFDYLTGPFADAMIAEGVSEPDVIKYVGRRPGKEANVGDISTTGQASNRELYRLTNRQLDQWAFQTAGICWFGVKADTIKEGRVLSEELFIPVTQRILQDQGETAVEMVYSSDDAVADAVGAPRDRVKSLVLTGMFGEPIDGKVAEWARMNHFATEMVAKLAERALLGLYFIENAPVRIEEAPLSRPERREIHRKQQKGKSTGEIASIVVIQSKRSTSTRPEVASERNYTHRWERRGYFMHLHDNNRHYQNRPDLVKPCHKCSREYDENEQARHEDKDLPYPNTESPDCIKIWVEPTVCGPEDLPLKKKVRIRRADRNDQEAA